MLFADRPHIARALLPWLLLLAAPTVKATLTQRSGPGAGETTLTVRLVATDMTLGSYQGTLRFTPGALTIASATPPKNDGTRVVNLADSAKGVIRFAGFTVSGFATDEVLSVVVRAPRGLDAAGLVVTPEVAGDIGGISVLRDRLIPARGATTETSKD